MQRDPFLKTDLPNIPQVTYRRPPTLETILAPSKLRQHQYRQKENGTKGAYRCKKSKCLTCTEISDKQKTFTGSISGESFDIRYHLTCQSSYVIYLITCICGNKYVGRTIQKLHNRANKHRANVRNKFILHGLSRHCITTHPENPNPYKILPIDYIPPSVHNRFENLRKREIYWIYRLQTLQPSGLNEISETII